MKIVVSDDSDVTADQDSIVTITQKPSTGSGGFYELINSPIVISFIGAIFVAWIAHSWESNETRLQLQTDTLVLFADEYSKYLNLLPGQKARGIYISTNKNLADEKRGEYADGRSFEDTVKLYESNLRHLSEIRDPYSLTAQVKAVFRGATSEEAALLDDLVDQMDTSYELNEFLTLHDKAFKQYRKLVQTMGENIGE